MIFCKVLLQIHFLSNISFGAAKCVIGTPSLLSRDQMLHVIKNSFHQALITQDLFVFIDHWLYDVAYLSYT